MCSVFVLTHLVLCVGRRGLSGYEASLLAGFDDDLHPGSDRRGGPGRRSRRNETPSASVFIKVVVGAARGWAVDNLPGWFQHWQPCIVASGWCYPCCPWC